MENSNQWQKKWQMPKPLRGTDLITHVIKWQNLALLIDISEYYQLSAEQQNQFINQYWKIDYYHPTWSKDRKKMLSQWKKLK